MRYVLVSLQYLRGSYYYYITGGRLRPPFRQTGNLHCKGFRYKRRDYDPQSWDSSNQPPLDSLLTNHPQHSWVVLIQKHLRFPSCPNVTFNLREILIYTNGDPEKRSIIVVEYLSLRWRSQINCHITEHCVLSKGPRLIPNGRSEIKVVPSDLFAFCNRSIIDDCFNWLMNEGNNRWRRGEETIKMYMKFGLSPQQCFCALLETSLQVGVDCRF